MIATDAAGAVASAFFQHLVHHPLTAKRPTSSTSIIHDSARNRVYVVNQDNDTVTSIDADKLQKLAELAVYRRPESLALTPEGKLWVVHQDDYAVAVVDPDRFVIEGGFRLPYASQPIGVAMSPTGDAAYVSLMAVGKLLKLDPRTGAVIGEVDGRSAAARDRGLARRQGRLRHPLHLAGHRGRGRQGRRGGDEGRDAHRAQARRRNGGQRSAGAWSSQLPVLRRAHARRPAGVGPGQEGQHRARQAARRPRSHPRHDGAAAGGRHRHAGGPGDLRQPGRPRRSQPARPRQLQPVRQLRDPDAGGLEPRRDPRRQPAHPGVLGDPGGGDVSARRRAGAGWAPVRAGFAQPRRPRL